MAVTLKQINYAVDRKSPPVCSCLLCSAHSYNPKHSACSSCRNGALLSSACCSGPVFPEGCAKGNSSIKTLHRLRNTQISLTQRNEPAGKLDELDVVSAPQQRLSVVQQNGCTDEELKGEVGVEGRQL